MRLTNRFLTAAASVLALGALSSCEDSCNNCNCDTYKIDYIVTSDSLNSPLSEVSSEQTVIIKGSNLSTTSEVYLVDSVGTAYSVPLNPVYVTDNNIIITLDCDANSVSTEKLVLVSKGGCRQEYAINKPVPAPSIKMLYSEFAADGDTIRIYGSSFISEPENKDTLKVWFYDVNNNPVYAKYQIANNNCELLIEVPAGVADSKQIGVKNSHGESISKFLFRDKRNIFLDFDNILASADHGALDTFSYDWSEAVKSGSLANDYATMKEKMGGKLPFGPTGDGDYYAAITNAPGFAFSSDQMLFYCPYSQGMPDTVNLMKPFTGQSIDNLVLKFEMYVPEVAPCASFFSIVFSAYATEDDKNPAKCYSVYPDGSCGEFYIRKLTGLDDYDDFYDSKSQTFTCKYSDGVPGAWFHPAAFGSMDEDNGSATVGKGYYTKHGWMTVAIPLSSDYFRYAVYAKGITTSDIYKACSTLKERDLCNMLIFNEDGQYQKALKSELGQLFFMGMDNFRIVPDDGNGARFTKYYGASSEYPY